MKFITTFTSVSALLNYLNKTYAKLHTDYENLFWISYMYDHTVDAKKDKAMFCRDAFRANAELLAEVNRHLSSSKGVTKERLLLWKKFFECYQTPAIAIHLKDNIMHLESKIQATRANRPEYYINPKTKKKINLPINAIKNLVATDDRENVRKACFDAVQILSEPMLDDFVELIKLRNEYAVVLGYEDFYAYKLDTEEGMKKKELFAIFDSIYEKTKYGFAELRKLEKTKKGLRAPWNFSYMMSGSFAKEDEAYYRFEEALPLWGRSFQSLGIDYKGGKLKLDLLERKGKYNNGFCHWPVLVAYENGKRVPSSSNFTCNVNLGMLGQASQGMHTLFHEGGHAAHLLHSEMKDVCVNHEYSPMSTAWAETQSMFLDTVFSSIEWRTRYLTDKDGNPYPLDLFERKVHALAPLAPLDMMSIMSVMYFEKELYEAKNLTKDKIKQIAKKVFTKYYDRSTSSLSLLEIPHIYTWESSCSYHGYGLAELALFQWREYFYNKYGYIVDNPNIGKEMAKVWKYGGAKTFPEFVMMATGKKLSPNAYIKNITATPKAKIILAKKKIERMRTIKKMTNPINLNASIEMVDGKTMIANNKKGFDSMAKAYAKWIKQQYKK